MSENLPDKQYTLETEFRSPLQAFMIKKMLGANSRDRQVGLELVDKYAGKISDIIDAPEHEDIRVLARAKKYDEAANLVFTALGMERPPEEELKKAA